MTDRVVLHVGCGPDDGVRLHSAFKDDGWREVRLDIDPAVKPDIVASLTDMRAVPSNSVDAVWSSHNIEHLLPHQVPVALREFLRVLKPDGFALVTLPDLQAVAALVVDDRLDDAAYFLSNGMPIAAHDMIYGWRRETAGGNDFYCHRTGFTAKTLYWALIAAGFAEVLVQRDQFSLWATAYKRQPEKAESLSGVDSEIYMPSEGDRLTNGYRLWQDQHPPATEYRTLCEQRMRSWPRSPRIHLALLAAKADESLLAATIDSLARQYFMPARVTIIAPFAPPSSCRDGERLVWRTAQQDNLLWEANQTLAEFDAEWVCMADTGDRFASHAFFALVEAALTHPGWQMIYSDEDRINNVGLCELPHFKPDFNLALLRGYPYMGGLLLAESALFARLGGFDHRQAGVEEYDFALRAYELAGEQAIGHVADVLYHRLTDGGHCNLPVPELIERGRVALAAHLERQGIAAKVEHGAFPASYRVRYGVTPEISASILVSADAGLPHLQRCVESMIGQTAWPHYELVLLVSADAPPEVRAYVDALGALGEPRLRTEVSNEMLSWAEARNRLAAMSFGEFLVFMEASCAVMQPDWLEELLGRVVQPGMAAVAPRLLGPDGKVFRTGAILGLNNRPVDTPFFEEALDYPGYYGRALLAQNFSALPAGCLVVHHEAFSTTGGFDADFSGDLAAADLCLRLTQAGKRLEWTPFASLLHTEGRQAVASDISAWGAFYTRWLPKMAHDPAYNPSLSLRHDFAVETLSALSHDPYPWKPLPRVIVNPADDSGSGEYRIAAPARALNRALQAQVITSRSTLSPAEMARVAPDAVVMQRQVYEHQVDAIRRYRRFGKAFHVFELDDLITDMPMKSALRPFMPEDAGHWLAEALKLCDRFIVSTHGLAEAYGHLHPDIRVVPNYLERARWQGLAPQRNAGRKPRVGWAGGNSHTGDLDVITDVVRLLADEVEWVFFGMSTDEIRPWLHECHAGVSLDDYPTKLASLNLDIALAPLEPHRFNECKSHLKLLEYGVLGYPVIATDIRAYEGDYPVTRVGNSTDDWVDAIREHIANPEGAAARGDTLREYVLKNWTLEDNLWVWKAAWMP